MPQRISLPPAEWLRAAARHSPHVPALYTQEATFDYRALLDRTERLALGLEASGVGTGSLVAVAAGSAPLIAHLVHATARLGSALLPLNPALPEATQWELMGTAGATHLIVEGEVNSAAGEPHRIAAGPLLRLLSAQVEARPVGVPATLDAVHLVLATSGTTGEPKGVMLSGRNLAAAVEGALQRLPLSEGDLWLDCLPLFHIGGLSILYRCVRQRAAVLLHQGFDVERVAHDLRRHPVNHLSLVPAMLARLLERWPGPPPPSLRFVLVGGGPLSASLARRAWRQGWPICPSYGMSETGSQLATYCGPPEQWQEGQAGQPLAGLEVVAGEEAECPGRIRVRGDAVMVGYVNRQRHPGDGLRDGWFETGDVGVVGADGRLRVMGRADDVLVSGGENIHPAQVERIVGECPGVRDVGVTARGDPVWGDVLVALVVGEPSTAELERWCRRHLRGAWRPREYVLVSELPRNAMGKLDRRALRAMADPSPAE